MEGLIIMSYNQIVESMKDLGLIPRDYDDSEAARKLNIFDTDRCVIFRKRDYSLQVSECSDNGDYWYDVHLTRNISGEWIFNFSSPLQLDSTHEYKREGHVDTNFRWKLKVDQYSEVDSFIVFSRFLLAMFFRCQLAEMTPEVISDLSVFVPIEERDNPDSPFVMRMMDDLLGWFRVLP
jgi:hypothetical protein